MLDKDYQFLAFVYFHSSRKLINKNSESSFAVCFQGICKLCVWCTILEYVYCLHSNGHRTLSFHFEKWLRLRYYVQQWLARLSRLLEEVEWIIPTQHFNNYAIISFHSVPFSVQCCKANISGCIYMSNLYAQQWLDIYKYIYIYIHYMQ